VSAKMAVEGSLIKEGVCIPSSMDIYRELQRTRAELNLPVDLPIDRNTGESSYTSSIEESVMSHM
jgi:hypothetical protein